MISNRIYPILLTAALLTVCLFSSCSDDDSFSASTSDRLTFEADTINFDTVITTIGSSTKRFKVFNKNDKGIRLTSVSLASGGSSGFRINVDGHSGSEITDVEILRKDSLYIFAEVTLDIQNSNEPVRVTDEILFHLESGLTQHVVLEAYGQDAILLHAPIISNDTEWTDSRPYIIYDSLIIDADASLTLEEGVELRFHKDSYIGVYGSIICNGSKEHPVTFRGDRTDRIFSYLPYDRMDAQWGGIILYAQSKNNLFEHVDIHGGNYGIDCPLSETDEFKFFVQNSVIHNVARNGLRARYCIGQVLNSQISNAGEDCVSLIGGVHTFVHTTIAQFYPWSGDHGTALYFTNVLNDTIYPIEQIVFANCLITGNTTDEIVGNRLENSDASFNVQFNHCLVNIKLNGDEGEDIKNMFATSVNETGNTKEWTKDANGAFSDEIIWGRRNFKLIDNDIFMYDFQLSDVSNARAIGSGEFVGFCPVDMNGIPRPSEKPDAGCYQYTN